MKSSREKIRKLTERAERAENRVRDLGAAMSRARDRETRICHQLGRMIHHVKKVEDKGPHQSYVFTSDEWKELIDEADKANKLLMGG